MLLVEIFKVGYRVGRIRGKDLVLPVTNIILAFGIKSLHS